MNKRASILLYGVMLGLTIVILALALAPAASESAGRAMNVTVGDTIGMDCTNSSISDFTRAACYATDISVSYFIAILLFIGGAAITAKIVFS